MNRKISTQLILVSILALVLNSSCRKSVTQMPGNKPDIEFYGLSNANGLIKYNANNVASAISNISITGLQSGETIMAIDFRPATGQLYGLGSTSRLYIINHETGMATAVGATPFTPAISGSMAGFDFNPAVDRIRMVTSSGQNLRLNPETGAVAATDAVINPGTPSVTAVAYTNSIAGTASTILYDIDIASGKLFKQDPPNNGTLAEVGSLGITASGECGFDISADNTVALATFNISGVATLHQIDLTTGKAANLGNFSGTIIGIAIPTMPVAYAVDMSNNLHIFNFKNPGMPVIKAITGLQVAENILGIDMRPATGQLYALGSSNRIYTINMSSGAATAVGSMPFLTPLAGTAFGFDFNPTVDRIRVVSNTGQNMRLNPTDGTVAAVDMSLNPGLPAVSAAAYTNNFPGATTTVLFDIDPATDKLYKQSPPNDGTLVEIGSLGVDIAAENGFDIGGTSNIAYGIFTSGSSTRIYSVNTTTGMATQLTDFPNTVKAFAVGLGF